LSTVEPGRLPTGRDPAGVAGRANTGDHLDDRDWAAGAATAFVVMAKNNAASEITAAGASGRSAARDEGRRMVQDLLLGPARNPLSGP
jgi:hypothetical protein